MIRNYIKIAVRNLWKHATSSVINLLGLTIGLSCCLLIGLYIQHEVSYDKFQQKGDRIARVIMEYSFGGDVSKGDFTSTKVAPSFKRNFPEVESAVRMSLEDQIVMHNDKVFTEGKFLYADSSFFDMFTYHLLQGNAQQALNGPGKVILTPAMAQKYFGAADPVGQVLYIGAEKEPYQVTGVMESFPANSHIKFDFLASFSSLGVIQERTYWEADYTTYLLLKDKTSFSSLQQKLEPFMKKEMASEKNATINYSLEPFMGIHLYSPYGRFEPGNNIIYIYVLTGVALLILFIACFTYINLATARSMERAREVGIRKVMGAVKKQLFWQFIGESLILVAIALLFSMLVVSVVLPAFNHLAQKELAFSGILSFRFLLLVVTAVLVVSLLGGFYPALILAGFQPVKVLKGVFRNSGSGLWVRKSLIVFQFAISVFLLVASMVIQKQLHFIRTKELGYNKDYVLELPVNEKMLQQWPLIKTEMLSDKEVSTVSRCVGSPGRIYSGYTMRTATMPEDQVYAVNANPVDEDFVKTMGLKIIAGKDFTAQDMKDVDKEKYEDKTGHFILNETAASALGWTSEQAVGKKMFLGSLPGYVSGVVKDFHFQSMREVVKPLVIFTEMRATTMLVKMSGHHLPETISNIESKWKKLVPAQPFEYRFLDQDINNMYRAEVKLGNILNIFTGIAIALACLGLFGLSSYAVQQRIKEIGVRKVLGASVSGIVGILSKEFIKLSLIAVLIALPVAYFAMNHWLQDFTYRIRISVWVLLLAIAITVFITILTISIKAVQAAFMNPVKALRSE
ncbi:MAG: ABC transporter permease [Chitinophagaceae bacterium]